MFHIHTRYRFLFLITLSSGISSLSAWAQTEPTVIPQENWTVRFVDSEEMVRADNRAEYAFDGNPNTIWHTEWATTEVPPHELQIDLGATYEVTELRYLPRQDRYPNGHISRYEVYVSSDGINWRSPAKAGTFSAYRKTKKHIYITPTQGRYVRLRALSEVNGNAWTSVAELEVVGIKKSADGVATLFSPTVVESDVGIDAPAKITGKTPDVTSTTSGGTHITSRAINKAPANTGAIDWSETIASASGNIYTVSSGTEFNYIASIVAPGDVVLIEDGTYVWPPLYVNSNGTPEAPIIYTAKNPGKVVFIGGQRLFRIAGNHNIIGGFVFKGISERVFHFTGAAGSRATGASDNRITDNAIIESGATTVGRICPCRMFEFERRAHRNRIDHNLFARNYGFIRIHLDSEDAVENGPSQDNIIDHNVFRDALGPHVPVLQIGQGEPSQAGSSQLQVRTVFEHNLIRNHNTTTGEIVSVKSSNNIVRFNTFENSHGGINLRHGNQSEVYGNYFKGGDSDAIAIHGAYHRVYENVVNGPNRRYGITLSRWGNRKSGVVRNGELVAAALPPTHNNFVYRNQVLSYRDYGLKVNFCNAEACYAISDSEIKDNVIVGSTGTLFSYDPRGASNVVISGNTYVPKNIAQLGTGYDYDLSPTVASSFAEPPLSAQPGLSVWIEDLTGF